MALDYDLATGWEDLWVYSAQGTLLGQTSVQSSYNGNTLGNLRVPSNENGSDGGMTYYQNLMVEWSSGFPTGTATFTSGSPTVTGSGFPTDSSWDHCFMNVGSASYIIASTTATTVTLTTNFAGSSGSASYEVNQPLFWTSGSGSSTIQPPTNLNATVN